MMLAQCACRTNLRAEHASETAGTQFLKLALVELCSPYKDFLSLLQSSARIPQFVELLFPKTTSTQQQAETSMSGNAAYCSQLRMSQPTVSKHLRVLREAGFVESTVDAQRRLYRLKPEPLQEIDAWLSQFRRFWSAHVDALERHLDRMDHEQYASSTPTKRKTKEKATRPEQRT